MRNHLLSLLALGALSLSVAACRNGNNELEDCGNGRDDDGDERADCDDDECAEVSFCLPEVCDNGIDDNGDGDLDCADVDCANDPVCDLPEVCGDGIFNAITEECDDGNTTAGDGCDAACLVEDGFACETAADPSLCEPLAEICAETVAAVIGDNAGDLAAGTFFFDEEGACPFGSGGAEVLFSLTPAADQTLVLTMTPGAGVDPALYVRTDCEDGATTLACADEGLDDVPETLTINATAGQALTIFADSFDVSGTFTLSIAVQ